MNENISFTWIIVGVVVLWLIVLIVSVSHIFKRTDLAMPMKVIWLLIILMFPVGGLIVYLIIGRRSKTTTNEVKKYNS
ncbi:MAG: PLDc N-terminal domain-containing protein [Bacteroidota bacterium]|jgi:hypothetical protein|nr:PLDc N-terminal domain-containing protein [Flavisolibacter sp.]MDQ3551653.1 PLDc N-terminal domain-containing protein [Bacteroidota bacterium]